jgi:hypothetical protein
MVSFRSNMKDKHVNQEARKFPESGFIGKRPNNQSHDPVGQKV